MTVKFITLQVSNIAGAKSIVWAASLRAFTNPRLPLLSKNPLMVQVGAGIVIRDIVCMYILIGKEQIAQERPYWGENVLKTKN